MAFAIYHPAAALRTPEIERTSYADVAGFRRRCSSREPDAAARTRATPSPRAGARSRGLAAMAVADAPIARAPSRSGRTRLHAVLIETRHLMAISNHPLRIIPLGGVGEIGKNMYVFEYGDEIVVIDCGLMFPDEEMFGIDLVIPDITYLKENKANVKAFLITHAHEDHVGAPAVRPARVSGRAGLRLDPRPRPPRQQDQGAQAPQQPAARPRARRRGPDRAVRRRRVPDRPFDPGCDGHRPPDAGRASSSTPATSSSTTPRSTASCRTSRSSPSSARRASSASCPTRRGPRTRATRPSERTVGEAFREIMEPLDGRVIVATFASNIARVQQVLDAAASFDRKVTVIGRSMEQNFRIATDLGYLKYDPSQIVAEGPDQRDPRRQARHLPRPAPRASRWRAWPGWRTATTDSSRSRPATP